MLPVAAVLRPALSAAAVVAAQQMADDLPAVFQIHVGQECGNVADVILRMGIQRAGKACDGILVVGLSLYAAEHGGQRGKQHGFDLVRARAGLLAHLGNTV